MSYGDFLPVGMLLLGRKAERLMIQERNRLPCLGPSSRLKKQETPAGEETDSPRYGERYRELQITEF